MEELTGPWRAAPADEELRRRFPDPSMDDADWLAVEVPGHWRDHPDLATSEGPVLYRTAFDGPDPGRDQRWWLTLDGVFSLADVWLDGSYLGDTDGYFIPHDFEITDHAHDRREHHLAVEVACPRPAPGEAKRTLLGVFDAPSQMYPDWNPGGIWRPVRIHRTGPVRITRLRAVCRDANPGEATLSLRAVLDAQGSGTIRMVTRIAGVERVAEHPVAAGYNAVEWRVQVPDPALWWPHSRGDQPLHRLEVEVSRRGEPVSDRRRLRVGLRSVRMRSGIVAVNDERLFLKGSNLAPTRPDMARVGRHQVDDTVALARDAGLDVLRVYGHVAHPSLYEAADEAGMLVWQDLPLVGPYARGARRPAMSAAARAVDQLGHHPSVALWCAHIRPSLPNRSWLDQSLRRELERRDPSRPVWTHVGVGLDGPALTLGWAGGDVRDLPSFAARLPRAVRFPSEFGAQAVPDTAAFCAPERWPGLDWDDLVTEHGYDRDVFETRIPPGAHESFDGWRRASQEHQATVVRRSIETLRRIKYRPTGGFLHHFLADAYPAISASVVDHRGVPKQAYEALRAACAPVIVVADQLPATVRHGQQVRTRVHVVNDGRDPVLDAEVTATLRWSGGSRTWRWAGEAPADGVDHVGTIEWTVPAAPGPLHLDLEVHGAPGATNGYESTIEP